MTTTRVINFGGVVGPTGPTGATGAAGPAGPIRGSVTINVTEILTSAEPTYVVDETDAEENYVIRFLGNGALLEDVDAFLQLPATPGLSWVVYNEIEESASVFYIKCATGNQYTIMPPGQGHFYVDYNGELQRLLEPYDASIVLDEFTNKLQASGDFTGRTIHGAIFRTDGFATASLGGWRLINWRGTTTNSAPTGISTTNVGVSTATLMIKAYVEGRRSGSAQACVCEISAGYIIDANVPTLIGSITKVLYTTAGAATADVNLVINGNAVDVEATGIFGQTWLWNVTLLESVRSV